MDSAIIDSIVKKNANSNDNNITNSVDVRERIDDLVAAIDNVLPWLKSDETNNSFAIPADGNNDNANLSGSTTEKLAVAKFQRIKII